MSETGYTDISIVADKYAVAMIQLAEQNDLLDKVNADLYLIKDIIRSNSELRDFLEHPLIKTEDKKEVLEKTFADHVSNITMNLVKVLADANRLFILPFIYDYYNKILSEKRNAGTATVVTAIPVNENVLNRVKEKLEKMFSKQINVQSEIDEDIIAGMVVTIGDKVIDGSIRAKLEDMKKQLC